MRQRLGKMKNVMNRLILKKGRDRSVLRQHPWIFSGAVERLHGNPKPGDTIDVFSADGRFLGRGAFSPLSQIRVRLWTFHEESIDNSFFEHRIRAALDRRLTLFGSVLPDAYRLISSEVDGLPGLVVDRYQNFLVCQFTSIGVELWKSTIVDLLISLTGIQNIYERSDVDVRKWEGLGPKTGVLAGDAPPPLIEIDEDGIKILVDIQNGHKTGFYLDQRENRKLVRQHSAGAEVLNCFAYTGGFGLAALQGGASHVTNVEDVGGLIELIDKNVQLNAFDPQRCTNVKADVFQLLRRYVNDNRTFDVIVLDPPKFVDSQARLVTAARGYKDINMLAFKLLRPGGLLFTFSCSGLVKMELFQKIVADAAIDSGRDAQIIHMMKQHVDHPILLCMPESYYLKGLMLRLLEETW